MAIKRYIQVGEQFNNASLPQAQPHPLIPSLASLYAKPDGAYSTEYSWFNNTRVFHFQPPPNQCHVTSMRVSKMFPLC